MNTPEHDSPTIPVTLTDAQKFRQQRLLLTATCQLSIKSQRDANSRSAPRPLSTGHKINMSINGVPRQIPSFQRRNL